MKTKRRGLGGIVGDAIGGGNPTGAFARHPRHRVFYSFLFTFTYSFFLIGWTLFNPTRTNPAIWRAPNDVSARELALVWGDPYAGHDAASYFLAAWSWYQEGILLSPDWQWVTNLWPPGMVIHHYAIVSIFGPEVPILALTAILALLLWTAVFTLYFGPLLTSLWRLPLILSAIPAVLILFPFSQWILGTYTPYPSGFAIGFFLLAVKLFHLAIERKGETYLLAILGGFLLAIAALYRVTNFLVINSLALIALLLIAGIVTKKISRREKIHFATSILLLSLLLIFFALSRAGFSFTSINIYQIVLSSLLVAAGTSAIFSLGRAFLSSRVEVQFLPTILVFAVVVFIVFQATVASYMGLTFLTLPHRASLVFYLVTLFLLVQTGVSGPTDSYRFRLLRLTGLHPTKNVASTGPNPAESKKTLAKKKYPLATFALLLFALPGLLITQMWTSFVTDKSHPQNRDYVIVVPALAYASAWQTDARIREYGAWRNNLSVNWACRLDPEQCLSIERLELASDSPYSGSGALTGAEFRERAILAALQNPAGYIEVRVGYLWLQWSSGHWIQGGFLAVLGLWGLGWSLYLTFKPRGKSRLTHMIWFLYFLLSTLPMAYILFFPYYFFPLQLGAVFYLLAHFRLQSRSNFREFVHTVLSKSSLGAVPKRAMRPPSLLNGTK